MKKFVYLYEYDTKVSISDGRFIISKSELVLEEIPIGLVLSFVVIGNSIFTNQAILECLKNNICISYINKYGVYQGQLFIPPTNHIKLQRQQCILHNTAFALDLAKRIIFAKISNQLVVLKNLAKQRDINCEDEINLIREKSKNINQLNDISKLLGYEGFTSRYYFKGLGKCIHKDFFFEKRSRLPPKDEFNSLISFSYSILSTLIFVNLQACGLNPYFGFIHQDKDHHPCLSSDLLEELRAPCIDRFVINLINHNLITKEHFIFNKKTKGCFLNKGGLNIFINKFTEHIDGKINYAITTDTNNDCNYKKLIYYQIQNLISAIENNQSFYYKPLRIR